MQARSLRHRASLSPVKMTNGSSDGSSQLSPINAHSPSNLITGPKLNVSVVWLKCSVRAAGCALSEIVYEVGTSSRTPPFNSKCFLQFINKVMRQPPASDFSQNTTFLKTHRVVCCVFPSLAGKRDVFVPEAVFFSRGAHENYGVPD